MQKSLLFLLIVLSLAGCTQQLQQYSVSNIYQSATGDYNLNILVTDDLLIRRTSLFSAEMTSLTLNLMNLAGVDFNNVKAVLINADDLNPVVQIDSAEVVRTNRSEKFEWDLTAPQLGLGETLVLNNILVRLYYDTYAEAEKTIVLKEPNDRNYISTYSYSSQSPVSLSFDTSYETVTTVEDGMKNFTVNMIYFNNYTGVVDYYDNSLIDDNYMRSVIVGIDKTLVFYNYLDKDSPWKKIDESLTDEQLIIYGLTRTDLLLYDYYYLEYLTLESAGYNICDIQLSGMTDDDYATLQNTLTEQRRVLWMTSGYTKINVLRLGAPTVESDTELLIKARVNYSYSQDYGGEGFGVIVYGLG